MSTCQNYTLCAALLINKNTGGGLTTGILQVRSHPFQSCLTCFQILSILQVSLQLLPSSKFSRAQAPWKHPETIDKPHRSYVCPGL